MALLVLEPVWSWCGGVAKPRRLFRPVQEGEGGEEMEEISGDNDAASCGHCIVMSTALQEIPETPELLGRPDRT